ncbi:MAG: hypothetical protein HYY17_08280 [Planctomycetes bacterium]|nr:hypothetical protein [Planctomycetota bacterium]
MTRFLPIALLLVLSACGDPSRSPGEEYSQFYRQPNRRKESVNLERKKIVRSTPDPRDPKKVVKEKVGYLERNEVTLEGSRTSREHYVILDRHFESIGFITVEGKFYRFDETGRRVFVGEYVIGDDPERRMFMTGLKVFFGISLNDSLSLEEIDPYGDQ